MGTPEVVNRLRRLEKQGEDYIWRVAKDAADEIERQDATIKYLKEEIGRLRAKLSGPRVPHYPTPDLSN